MVQEGGSGTPKEWTLQNRHQKIYGATFMQLLELEHSTEYDIVFTYLKFNT